MAIQRVFLVRHGETKWSVSGQHTGMTDIPLTENGREIPRRLAPILAKVTFARILTSPLQRARETCALAGLGERAETEDGLVEWNYGDYEGLTPREIDARAPGWMLFTHRCPGGEGPEDVTRRVDSVIERVRAVEAHVALPTATSSGSSWRDGSAFRPRPGVTSFSTGDRERPQLLPRRPRDKAVERPGRCGRI